MAHNDFVLGGTGSGSWNSVEIVHTMMEKFDQRQFEAINGDLGGTWAPSSQIVIGGSGMQVTGLAISGQMTFNIGSFVVSAADSLRGNFWFGDGVHNADVRVRNGSTLLVESGGTQTFAVGSTLTISGVSTVNGNLTANNSTWALVGTIVNMTGAGQIGVSGTSTIVVGASAGIVMSGTLSQAAGSHLDFASGADVTGIVAWKAALALSASGRILANLVDGPDADHTFAIGDATMVRIPNVVADRIYKLDKTGALNGESIEMYVPLSTNGHVVEVQRTSGTVLTDMKNAATFKYYAKFVYRATVGDFELAAFTAL